jgi:hypothetical protein
MLRRVRASRRGSGLVGVDPPPQAKRNSEARRGTVTTTNDRSAELALDLRVPHVELVSRLLDPPVEKSAITVVERSTRILPHIESPLLGFT